MRALLSVSNKEGLVEFARHLVELGFELVSTGGTHQHLRQFGLPVSYVSDITGFPEILGGRVKTLHPRIHAGLLAQPTQEHQAELDQHQIQRFHLLVVNLYPFRETLASGASYEECIENIDVGGPAMLRAAAKNHPAVLPICDPLDYPRVIEAFKTGIASSFRQELAYKAFAHTASYDSAIANFLQTERFPSKRVLILESAHPLRYGENPHQHALLYREDGSSGPVLDARVLAGKPMGYNNYADADAAWSLVMEFDEPACVAVKHANPCGVAVAADAKTAWEKARDADTVSVFGGVIALNRAVDLQAAQAMKGTFLEVLIAPKIEDGALEWFKEKKPDLRVLEAGKNHSGPLEYRSLAGGMLVQERDLVRWEELEPQVVSLREPSEAEWADLEFAFYVSKHARSNNIVVAKQGITLGIGAGAVSRIWAAERAILNANEKARGAVLASEAFFPFDDVVRLAAQAGICAILQPGGAKRDAEIIKAADELGVSMVFTGSRHFRH